MLCDKAKPGADDRANEPEDHRGASPPSLTTDKKPRADSDDETDRADGAKRGPIDDGGYRDADYDYYLDLDRSVPRFVSASALLWGDPHPKHTTELLLPSRTRSGDRLNNVNVKLASSETNPQPVH